MKTGTILSMDQKHAYVFTSDCHMVKISCQPDMAVGKEISMEIEQTRERPVVKNRRLSLALVAASLVLLLAVGLIFGQGLLAKPVYARLSIDVNPSLELALNRQLEVQSVRTMNEEARQLMAGQDFTGLGWQEAVARWAEILRLTNRIQLQNMLISAVMPEDAVQLRTQLQNMEGNANQGTLAGVAVRVIYSHDQSVAVQARQNGLSIGRQMLLNQARAQNQNYDQASIGDAPLGDLIQKLLQDREQNQTRLTERTTQSVSDQTGESTPAGTTETNRETSQETNRETSGATQGSGSQQTNRETNQETNRETSGSTLDSGSQQTNQETSGSTQGSGSQQTNQETSGSTQGSGTGGEGSQSQQTSQIKSTTHS